MNVLINNTKSKQIEILCYNKWPNQHSFVFSSSVQNRTMNIDNDKIRKCIFGIHNTYILH